MNKFDLSFLKYLQDHNPLPIQDATARFGKTLSTLKRTMKEINTLLPVDLQLRQDNAFITTRLSYNDYIQFLEKVQFNRYLTTPDERVQDLFVALCLNDVVNKNDYYKKFYVSPGTLKNDNPLMMRWMEQYGLQLTSLAHRGSQLNGDEFRLRLAVCMLILKTVEIGEENRLIAHNANEPINRSIATQFLSACEDEIHQAAALYAAHVAPVSPLGYNGKKYFLVYLCVSLLRQKIGRKLNNTSAADFITTFPWQILDDPQESALLDLIIASVTFTDRPFTLYDPSLVAHVRRFSERVSGALVSTIHNPAEWFARIYDFLFAAIIQNKFGLWFDDKKLHDVRAQYPDLWACTQTALGEMETHWGITFSSVHVATLVLIIKKFELQNRVVGERKKRVIIVTNSSESKVGFFKEVLHSWFHIDIPLCININEIERLQDEPFDLLITFTNKISSYLKYAGFDSVKVNFHLTQDDITLLRQCGLSRARKKIPAAEFVHEIRGMDEKNLLIFLKQHYGDQFI